MTPAEVKACIVSDIDLLMEAYHDMQARCEDDPDTLIESIKAKIQQYDRVE